MKKMFFTAIALVAFASISNANTLELKELKSEELNQANAKKEILDVSKLLRINCIEWAMNMVAILDPDVTSSNEQTFMMYQALHDSCEKRNK